MLIEKIFSSQEALDISKVYEVRFIEAESKCSRLFNLSS